MSVSFKVKIFDSKGTHVLQVAKSTLTIGSAPHCDVVLEHPSVNAEHARAWLEGGRIWVQDLGSAPGTALNEIRLPGLKPMLVRDLDVLRLGQSEATLGLEAVLVRAPVVKPKTKSSDAPQMPVAEEKSAVRDLQVEKRREELEALGRELADMRRQMQMAKLEKGSAEDLTQQLQNLNSEIKSVQEQKVKWNETLRQMEIEKQTMRKNVETELAEFKAATLNDLKTHREKDARQNEAWRQNCLTELTREVSEIMVRKEKRWHSRMFSSDMLLEWQLDMAHAFKKVLFNDTSPAPKHADLLAVSQQAQPSARPQQIHISPSLSPKVSAAMAMEETRVHVPRKKSKRPVKKSAFAWQGWAGGALVLLVVVGAWFNYSRQHGVKTLSSQAPDPTIRRVPARYEPKQSNKYRSSYTENVLFLENYVSAEANMDFRKRWGTELNKAAMNDWKLDQWAAGPVLAKEEALIRDLSRIKDSINPEREQEGINQMRTREAQFLKDLEGSFKNRASVERFLKFKHSFYVRNQAYLTTNR